VRAVRTLARARGVALAFAPDAELPVRADAQLVRRAVLNLLDNAIKHTPPGGSVRVGVARVEAEPPGPDAPPAETPRIEEPAADPPPADPPPADDAAPPLALLLDARWTGDAPDEPVAPAAPPRPQADPPPGTGPWARVTVADTGPGIPADAQPHVFERFYRARGSAAGAGDTPGAGLGLAIVASVAAAHGGRVTLVRSDARGTVFAIDLPLDVAAVAAPPEAPPELPPEADPGQARRRSTPAVSRSSSPPTSAVTSATPAG
jgi:signal transduction histidine kinase